jgi:hypothetical protein
VKLDVFNIGRTKQRLSVLTVCKHMIALRLGKRLFTLWLCFKVV